MEIFANFNGIDSYKMFKIDFIVWKSFKATPTERELFRFKIDFIVWKFMTKSKKKTASEKFKIDFIVWKYWYLISHFGNFP